MTAHIKPNFSSLNSKWEKTDYQLVKEASKPKIVSYQSDKFQINPTAIAGHTTVAGKQKQQRTKTVKVNRDFSQTLNVHLGKVGISIGIDKFVYGNDPSITQVLKDISIFAISDMIAQRIDDNLMIDNALSFLSESQRDLLSAVFINLLVNSAVSGFKMPEMRDVVLLATPEIIDDFVIKNYEL